MSKVVNNPTFQYSPKHEHDSDSCIFLGTYHNIYDNTVMDLYFSSQRVLIARFGVDGEYYSLSCDFVHFVEKHYSKDNEKCSSRAGIRECIKRARIFGYID